MTRRKHARSSKTPFYLTSPNVDRSWPAGCRCRSCIASGGRCPTTDGPVQVFRFYALNLESAQKEHVPLVHDANPLPIMRTRDNSANQYCTSQKAKSDLDRCAKMLRRLTRAIRGESKRLNGRRFGYVRPTVFIVICTATVMQMAGSVTIRIDRAWPDDRQE